MTLDADPCGTYAGWNRHKSRGERPCQPCLDAVATYMAQRRFRQGSQHTPRSCKDCGSVFTGHRCSMAARP